MRKKIFMAVLVFGLILLCACTRSGQTQEDGFRLYFPVIRSQSYGSALSFERWEGESDTPTPEQLLEALLAGPTSEQLRSPFPGAVQIQSLELDEECKLLHITLSEQYSGLTDMAQTLADACIVMTACQLPGVEAVEISSAGFWGSRPANRTLTPAEFELDSLLP